MEIKYENVIRGRPMHWSLLYWGVLRKKILGCSSRTCNKVIRGDMGLDTLRSCRDKAKLVYARS